MADGTVAAFLLIFYALLLGYAVTRAEQQSKRRHPGHFG